MNDKVWNDSNQKDMFLTSETPRFSKIPNAIKKKWHERRTTKFVATDKPCRWGFRQYLSLFQGLGLRSQIK